MNNISHRHLNETSFTDKLLYLLFPLATSAAVKADDPGGISSHDVIWNNHGKNSADSMPIGNGELGINLWVEGNGDLHRTPSDPGPSAGREPKG